MITNPKTHFFAQYNRKFEICGELDSNMDSKEDSKDRIQKRIEYRRGSNSKEGSEYRVQKRIGFNNELNVHKENAEIGFRLKKNPMVDSAEAYSRGFNEKEMDLVTQ